MDINQINRILNRGEFKYRQQISNMKKKLLIQDYKTILNSLLVKEILYLNQRLEIYKSQENVEPLSPHSTSLETATWL